MAKKSGVPKKKPRRVLYLGDDQSYWLNIQKRFRSQYSKFNWEFIKAYGVNAEEYQATFIEIFESDPSIIYIDFSTRTDEHLTIANFLVRENALSGIALIGLVPEQKMIKSVLSSGVDILHIKCGEFHDVIWQAVNLAYASESGETGFAIAKTLMETRLKDSFRIGYLTPTYVHCEGNLKLSKGDIIEINSKIPEKIVPSKRYIVKKIDDTDLYYDFKYSYQLEYIYVDEPDVEAESKAELIGIEDPEEQKKILDRFNSIGKEELNKYKDRLKKSKKEVKEWIFENSGRSKPKVTKVLIVDRSLSILKNDPQPIDKLPYTFRFQTELKPNMSEINAIRPNIIAIEFMGKPIIETVSDISDVVLSEEEQIKADLAEKRKNEESEMAQISRVIETIKALENYDPFVIIFNSYKHSSKSLQDSLLYPTIIAHPSNMEMSIVLHMSKMHETKKSKAAEAKIKIKIATLKKQDPAKYRNLTEADFNEKRYYVGKKNPLSFVSTYYPLELESVSESEVIVLSGIELEERTYRLSILCDFSIAIVPHPDGAVKNNVDEKFQYRGLIHSIGESEKKIIRKFVNEIFFQPLMEEKAKDLDAFNDLNEKVYKEIEKKKIEEEKLKLQKEKVKTKALRVEPQVILSGSESSDEELFESSAGNDDKKDAS